MTRIVALLLLLASSAHADPRWWWDDMRLTATPADSVMPHVTIPGYAFGGGTVRSPDENLNGQIGAGTLVPVSDATLEK